MLLRSVRRCPVRNVRYASGYSPKVRAIPFAISSEQAIIQLGPHVSTSTAGKGIIGSLGARYLPGFGFKPIQPTHIQAVYLPSWIVSALFTVELRLKSMKKETIAVYSDDSHMPGFSYKPLSALSFLKPGKIPRTVPMTPELERQHGSDILCWPYTLSPLSLPEFAKSLSQSQLILGDNATWDPESLNFEMLCAYPVLVPIYVARYEVGPLSLDCMILASSEKGLIYIDFGGVSDLGELVREKAPDSAILRQLSDLWTDPGIIAVRGEEPGFSKFRTVDSTGDSNLGGSSFSSLVDGFVGDLDVLLKFGVDMDDLRVRECSKSEYEANGLWMYKQLLLQQQKRWFNNIDRLENKMKSLSEPAQKSVTKLMGEAIDIPELQKTLTRNLEDEIKAEKPGWLEEYELLQHSRQSSKAKK